MPAEKTERSNASSSISVRAKPALLRSANRPTRTQPPGTSSATCTICPQRTKWALFNRSWYNRAGVAKVMGFCTEQEYERFLEDLLPSEHMLIGAGLQIMKYYLDISKVQQKRRLRSRRRDPLKNWKTSPVDKVALKRFGMYTEARDRMLNETSSPLSPWIVVRADDKRAARPISSAT